MLAKKIERFPSRIVVELTPVCNLSCAMCPRHYVEGSNDFIDKFLFKKLVDEIVRERPDAILLPFWRGESCMHPDFIELMNYALDRSLQIHLSTNGHYMSNEYKEVFYRCNFLTFSIHTQIGYQNAHEFVSKKPDGSLVVTQISFVEGEKSVGRYLNDCITDPLLKGFDSIRLYAQHTVDGVFGKSKITVNKQRTFCPKLEHTFIVAADGSFSRCNHIWLTENEHNLSLSTISDVWNSERMFHIRKLYPDEQCAHCDQWSGHTNGESWSINAFGDIEHFLWSVDA